MFNFLKKCSNGVGIVFLVFLGLGVVYSFSSFIGGCVDKSPALYILADLFGLLCILAVFGLAMYAVIAKKERLFAILIAAQFIYAVVGYFYNGEFFFTYLHNASVYSDTNSFLTTYYVFYGIQFLIMFAFAVLVLLAVLLKKEIFVKVGTFVEFAYFLIAFIIFILAIVRVAKYHADWYTLFNNIGNMVFAGVLTLVINHEKFLPSEAAI